MHQELYAHNTQIEELQPSSRSSWTQNNPSSPLFQNYVHFQVLAQQYPSNNYKQLSNHQLHELVYCPEKVYDSYSKCYVNKFVSTVMDYNNLAYSKILELEKKEERADKKKNKRIREKKDSMSKSQSQSSILSNPNSSKIQQSINVYLDEAERILEYAASCGKLINRKLIISILNNQACYYQKLWELEKACSYIEASILNMEQWGQQSHWSQLNPSPVSMSIQEENMIEKVSFKKQPRSSGDFSTKVQFKHDQTLPEKLAKNYQLQNRFTPSYYYDKEIQYTDKKDIANHIAKMCELSMYYLQYCSLCGQLSNHQKAIEAAKKVISKMKKVIKINKYYYLNSKQNEEGKSEIVMKGEGMVLNLKRKKFIVGLSSIEERVGNQILQEEIEKYRQTARFYLRERQKFVHQSFYKNEKEGKNKVLIFHKINKTEHLKMESDFEDKFDDLSTEMEKIKYQLKNFTIGNILQVKPKLYRFLQSDQIPKQHSKSKIQYERHSFENYEFTSPFSFQFIFTNALLLSTGYFTLATELRLQAAKEEVIEGQRFQTKLYKESQIYHLIAIIIISIYVPIDILYLKQLVTSYENYYVKQISPIDEMQGNEYGNGPANNQQNSQNTRQVQILNEKFDKQKIYSDVEKKCESEQKKEEVKKERKKTKKSKSKSKSSKSKSLKKGLNEYKGMKNVKKKQFDKLKSLKTSVKQKQEKKNSFNEEIPYISVSNRGKVGSRKKSNSEKKNKMSRSILVKMQKSENIETFKYKQILNNISRSTNMLADKSKSLSNRIKQHKNSSINSNQEKVSQFAKDKDLFEKENFKDKRKKKARCSSKELRIQHKKRSEYKLNSKSLKKEGSLSKLGSKSKSKQKSKAKDTSIPNNFMPEQTKKPMGYKTSQYDQGGVRQKIHIIDQLNKKIESTRKREENIESYYDEKDTKREFKLKKGKKNKNQIALSNSVSKKMGPYRTGKIIKESPKAPKISKKVIPVI